MTIPEIITAIHLFVFFHALLSHFHIWMTRLAGLFNHRKLLGCTIKFVSLFCFNVLLLAQRRRCHKANQFETMTERIFLPERGALKVLCQDVERERPACGIELS